MAHGTCILPDCQRPRYAKGVCKTDYSRISRSGEPFPVLPERRCPECDAPIGHRRADALACSRTCRYQLQRRTAGEALRARRHAHYMANRDEICAKSRQAYKNADRDARAEARRNYYEATKDRFVERLRRYNQTRRGKKADYDRAHRERNRERLSVAKSIWKKRQRDIIIAKRRAYYAANKTKYRVWDQARRARKLQGAGGAELSFRDWVRLINRFDGRCAHCGTKPSALHMDHVIPLSRGGRHTIGNVVPSCPSCNCARGNRLLVEWRARNLALARIGVGTVENG